MNPAAPTIYGIFTDRQGAAVPLDVPRARMLIASLQGFVNGEKVPERKGLTARQSEVFDFIEQHITAYGYPPSIREMMTQFSISSTNGVADHLKALERKGWIHRSGGKSRAIQVVGREAA